MSALPSQLSTMLQPPEARHWRLPTGLLRGLAGATHSSRSSGTPAAANAGGRRAGAAAPPSRASDLQCSDASSAAAGELANAGPGREKFDQRAGGPAATRQHGIERAVTGGVALWGVPLKRLPRHTRSPGRSASESGRWRRDMAVCACGLAAGFSAQPVAADQPHRQAFDFEQLARVSTTMGSKSGLAGSSSTMWPLRARVLTVTSSCTRATTIWPARAAGAMHREQVAIEDAGIAHAHAAHLEQVIGARREHRRIDLQALADMGLGKNRAARRDPPDERQAEGFEQADTRARPSSRVMTPLVASARRWVSGALGERKPKAVQISARVGAPFVDLGVANELQDFLLTRGQGFGHRLLRLVAVFFVQLEGNGEG